MYRIGGVMVSVLDWSVVDHGFAPRSGQPKTMQLVCVASLLSTLLLLLSVFLASGSFTFTLSYLACIIAN